MAKNTSSNAFRKIDVDQYNEDNFREDDGVDSAAAGPDENEITALLTQGKSVEALLSALQNAPLRCKNQNVKVGACSEINPPPLILLIPPGICRTTP